MKKLGKILFVTLGVIVLLLLVAITFTIGWRPFIGPRARPLTDRKFESTPERLAKGKYIAETVCLGCHSPHDWSAHGGPIPTGKEGSGMVMPLEGLPGRIVASNLTPDKETGAGSWTDDQMARAIREGIGHDGRTLFPIMPYPYLKHMSDEDLASVIVYLRSLPPVKNTLPPTEVIFPVKYLIRNVPQPVTAPVSAPDPSDRVKWGEYLVVRSACQECHTPMVGAGRRPPELAFSGGFRADGPWGAVASANITPDASGIAFYDEALFISAMRTGYVKARKLSSIMPFAEYKNYSDDDLKAMFAYLRTLKPIRHRVDNSEPPTDCKICRGKHGAGDKN